MIVLLGAFLFACPPAPLPPPTLDAAAPTTCAAACANLHRLGCPEGAPTCEAVCAHVESEALTDLYLGCLAGATNKAEARACNSVVCP